jgi:hypothetical protein
MALKSAKGFVSIWVGTFKSKTDFNKYVELSESEDCKFDRDFNLCYDPDFRECVYREQIQPVEELLVRSSYSDSYLSLVRKKTNIRGNAKVVLVDYTYTPLRKPPKSKLEFIGVFPYQSDDEAKIQAIFDEVRRQEEQGK